MAEVAVACCQNPTDVPIAVVQDKVDTLTFLTDANWLAAVSWLSLLATAIGLAAAWWQLRRTANATIAATDATAKALNQVRGRVALRLAIECCAELRKIRSVLHTQNYEILSVSLDALNAKILELGASTTSSSVELQKYRKAIQKIRFDVSAVEHGKLAALDLVKVNKVCVEAEDVFSEIAISLRPENSTASSQS